MIELTHTAFQKAFREGFEYSDFFRDHQLRPQHIGDVRRDYIHFVDSNWDLKAVLIQVSYNQYKSFRATELQSLHCNRGKHPRKELRTEVRKYRTL